MLIVKFDVIGGPADDGAGHDIFPYIALPVYEHSFRYGIVSLAYESSRGKWTDDLQQHPVPPVPSDSTCHPLRCYPKIYFEQI